MGAAGLRVKERVRRGEEGVGRVLGWKRVMDWRQPGRVMRVERKQYILKTNTRGGRGGE